MPSSTFHYNGYLLLKSMTFAAQLPLNCELTVWFVSNVIAHSYNPSIFIQTNSVVLISLHILHDTLAHLRINNCQRILS